MNRIALTPALRATLREKGVSCLHIDGTVFPKDVALEPPCSLKWMQIEHSLRMGAFSYAVSGYYFACRIGRYCSFGENVQIGRHGHPLHYFSSSPFFYTPYTAVLDQSPPPLHAIDPVADFRRNSPPVTLQLTEIGHDVWIGHGAFVLPGVRLGTGSAVAARAVVTHDVPPYALVAGIPAQVRRYRFAEATCQALLASKWWQFAPWQLRGASCDVIDDFLEHVFRLRSREKPIYAPETVSFAALD
jgi:acetyltransferase-like isoleucine patch superfamily enzyme